jgi:hypothetical protein
VEPGDDGRYESPVERLAGARSSARQARVVAVIVTLVVAGAIGLSVLPGARLGPAPLEPSPRAPALADAGPTSFDPGTIDDGSPRQSAPGRIETLVSLPDRFIDGAPRPILVARSGDDGTVAEWTPGGGLTVIHTFPGAFAGLGDGPVSPVLSPRGDRLLILASPVGGIASGDRGRLLDTAGSTLWEGDGLAAWAGAAWSPDGRVLVTAAQQGSWQIVTTLPSGRASPRVVALPPDVFHPAPSAGAAGPVALEELTMPVGFSADGRWIYGATVSSRLGSVTGQFRVGTDDGRIQAVASFRVGRIDGLLPSADTFGGRLVDPTTGTIADWRSNVDFSSGPIIEVRRPDGTFVFVVNAGVPLGAAWDADGKLYVLAADEIVYPDRTALVRIGQRGAVDKTLLLTGPVTGAALVGVRHGFAALLIATSRPSAESQIVLVDLANPERSAALALVADPALEILTASLPP